MGSGLGLTEVQDRNGCEGVEQEGGSVSYTCPQFSSFWKIRTDKHCRAI